MPASMFTALLFIDGCILHMLDIPLNIKTTGFILISFALYTY